jgi:alpha-mannosidase
MEMLYDKPNAWPSWELDYDEVKAKPLEYVTGPATIEVVENGPVRVALLITRKTEKSVFKTKVSLGSGMCADRVTFDSEIDWYERETMLKTAFKFTSQNEHVTYDLGLGTIQRGRNHPKLYEVPGQQWADLTSRQGDYGVAVMNDCKYGWDHPDSSTIRLTLIHTPGVYDSWSWVEDERSQDNGHHNLSYAVVGHSGDWREGQVVRQGAAFNQPMIAFQASSHPGSLGKTHSLLTVDAGTGSVHVNAIKQAEVSDEIIVRLRETSGLATPSVTVRFFSPIVNAREVNGAEEPIGPATVTDGVLRTSFGPYQPRAFAVRLQQSADIVGAKPASKPLTLSYDLDGISLDDGRTDGDFEGGRTIAGEMLPDTIVDRDIVYVTGPKTAGALNVVSCNGQTLQLPSASANAIAILVNSVGGPAQGVFSVGGHDTTIWIQDYAEPIAQWNNRLVAGSFVEEPDQIAPGYINRQDVAWYSSHRHNAHNENEAYQFTYLFRVMLPVPAGATTLTLPSNPRIRLFAATAVENLPDAARPAQPLYDVQNATLPRVIAHRKSFVDSLVVELSTPTPGTSLHYTVDGSEPTEQSPMYAGPIVVTETTKLKARALHANLDDGYVAAATFTRLGMTEPIVPAKTSPGLACFYYEGSWDKLPGFDTLKSAKSVILDSVAVPPFARDEDYGVVLSGYITVPKDGLYDFFIGSDDGSDFRIADTLLIDNDGLHGMGDVEGGVGLKAGTHQIQIRMFQKKGDEGLRLLVDGPGVRKQSVPPSWLSHAPEMKRAKR